MRQLPKTASNFAIGVMPNKYNFEFEISILMEKKKKKTTMKTTGAKKVHKTYIAKCLQLFGWKIST